MTLLSGLFRPFERKLRRVPPGQLLVCGALDAGDRLFGAQELRSLAAQFQIADVAQYKAGQHGRAVRLAGVLAACAPRSGPLYLNVSSRDGCKRLVFWRMEVEPLGLIVYDSGPLQLVVPGFHGARERIDDLALIEVATQPGRERPG